MRIITRPIERWPASSARDHERTQSRFSVSWTRAMNDLKHEARHLGADEIVMQLALSESDIRIDGEPYARAKPDHPGVIVSMETRHGPLSIPCDAFRGTGSWDFLPGWQANVRAVSLGLSDLRRLDRYGIATHGEQYVGWKAIESGEGSMTSKENAALLLLEEANMGEPVESLIADGEIRAKVYRKAAMRTHPDQNGDDYRPRFDAVQLALEVLSR